MFLRTRRRVRPRAACLRGGAIYLRLLGRRSCLLAAPDGLLRALAGARVRLRPLAVHGQAAPVAESAIGTDLLQPLDRLGALAAQVTLHLQLAVDVVAELRDLLVREVADLRVRGDGHRLADLVRAGAADAVDVRQRDLKPLLARKVDPCDSRHSPTPASACAAGSCK